MFWKHTNKATLSALTATRLVDCCAIIVGAAGADLARFALVTGVGEFIRSIGVQDLSRAGRRGFWVVGRYRLRRCVGHRVGLNLNYEGAIESKCGRGKIG